MALSTRLKDLDTTSTNLRIVDRARAPAAAFRPNIKLNKGWVREDTQERH
jgi:hypothetical protein